MAEHKGFDNPPIAYINLIRDNLRDRYRSGFPIVKELVQNADDAGATHLDLGWTVGLGPDAHPLLQGPGLFVVNNGAFSWRDADAIHQMGLSERAHEKSTIGKFGLGLKSVFHLCEAFFYLASEPGDDEWQSEFARCDVLNPWTGKSSHAQIHDDWNHFSELDQQRLRDRLGMFIREAPWFILWLPLRQQRHLNGVAPIKEGEFPGDGEGPPDDMLTPAVAAQLATLLPMLRSIESIRAWTAANTETGLANVFTVRLADESSRRRFSGEWEMPGTWALEGSVQVNTVDARDIVQRGRCSYAGLERILDDPQFAAMRAEEQWPRYSTYDKHTYATRSDPEKAIPHCAAYFSEEPAGTQGLGINRAVFLPVGAPEGPYPLAGSQGIRLTLHSYAFIDAGRSYLKHEPAEAIEARWNAALDAEGVYPMILPALQRYVAVAKLGNPTVERLTQVLESTALFHQHRRAICRDRQWVRALTNEGTPWNWQLAPTNRPLVLIPSPPRDDEGRWRRLFPDLVSLSDRFTITQTGWSRLVANDATTDWPEPTLHALLDGIPSEALRAGLELEYLLTFLETCAGAAIQYPATARRILHLANAVLLHTPVEQWSGNTRLLRRLALLVPPSQRRVFRLERTDDMDDPIAWCAALQQVLSLDLDLFVLPDLLDPPESPSSGELCILDAGRILHLIVDPPAAWRASGWWDLPASRYNITTALALNALQGTGEGTFGEVLAPFGALPVLHGQECRTFKLQPLSIHEIHGLHAARTLFSYGARPNTRGLVAELQSALRDRQVVLIRPAIARSLFVAGNVTPCDGAACMKALDAHPALAPAHQRAALLRQLREGARTVEERRAVRYLLHGEAAAYLEDGVELLAEPEEAGTLWATLARQALAQRGEGWRVLPTTLVDELSRAQRQKLGVTAVDPPAVSALLEACGPERIDVSALTADDRQRVLLELDAQITARMCIHEDIHGCLRAAGPGTYLEDRFPLDAPLFRDLAILRRSPVPQIAERQRRIATPLTAVSALRLALTHPTPAEHWLVIMGALEELAGGDHMPMLDTLRTTPWLPTHYGAVTPQQIVHLPQLDDEVARIVASCANGFVDALSVEPDLRQHAAFDVLLARVFPGPREALASLGEIMGQVESYLLGEIPLDDFDLHSFVAAFAEAPEELMPSRTLLDRMRRQPYADLGETHLLPRLARDPSRERLIEILIFLAHKHETATPDRAPAILDLFYCYFERAASAATLSAALPTIRLLSQRGTWKPAAELCLEDLVDNLDPGDLLDERASRLMRASGYASRVDGGAATSGIQERATSPVPPADAAAQLSAYFLPWKEYVPEEIIGGLLCLLGDEPALRELAQQYLGGRHLDAARDLFAWRILNAEVLGNIVGGSGEDVHAAMAKQRCTVEIEHNMGGEITVPNLLGRTFTARKREGLASLLIGAPWGVRPPHFANFRHSVLRLQLLDPSRYTPGELTELLRETARAVLSKWYLQDCPNLEDVWEQLGESKQLAVDVAANTLLESANFYLRQLRLHQQGKLGPLLLAWDAAGTRKAEEHQAAHVRGQAVQSRADAELARTREAVRTLLQHDAETQALVLASLREMMSGHYQYTPQSIPFELFQNADDAVLELAHLRDDEEPADGGRQVFTIAWDPQHLRFVHHGRAINQFRRGVRDRRDLGFDRDLAKMLVLSASDKGAAGRDGNTTGKFGLGFKSVFFVTDTPLVLSGRLGFGVAGGLLPRVLTPEERAALEQSRTLLSGSSAREATLIALPIRPASQAPETILRRFLDLAHVLVVFARQIRACEIRPPTGNPITVSWTPAPLTTLPSIEVGELRSIATREPAVDVRRAIAIHCGPGTVLLPLGPRGFRTLPADVPTIWVTAPTQEASDLGIAINCATFDLDVGRAQLARRADANNERAQEMGRALGAALCSFFDLVGRAWEATRAQLGLAADTEPRELWTSLWEVLAEPLAARWCQEEPSEAVRIVHQVVAGMGQHGLARLLSEHPTIPTGLPGRYQALARLDDIHAVTSGSLSRDREIAIVSNWPVFHASAEPRTIVSGKIWRVVQALVPQDRNPEPVTLATLCERALGRECRATPEVARRLGEVVTRSFLESLRGAEDYQDEYQHLQRLLSEVRFRARDGSPVLGRDLLLATDETAETKDEWARAGFAPGGRVLADDYTGTGRLFFKACRELAASSEELARWGVDATTAAKRLAFLRYLLEGELSNTLSSQVRRLCAGTWLEGLEDDPVLQEFGLQEQKRLLASLHLYREPIPATLMSFAVNSLSLQPAADPGAVLRAIHSWWASHRSRYERLYEERLYPSGQPPRLSRAFDPADQDCREAWMTLLVLGVTAPMGRTVAQQQRSFLQFCRDMGWFDVFAAPLEPWQPPDPQKWMGLVDEFLEGGTDHIRFYNHMRQFISIYAGSRWLDEYVATFLAIDALGKAVSLSNIVRPRTFSGFQGGGPDAPPLGQALGLGACFVVRELARQGVLSSEYAHPHCYMPVGRLRRLFVTYFGVPISSAVDGSWDIYNFLCDQLTSQGATFHRDFDLPFLTILDDEKEGLRDRFFPGWQQTNEENEV